MEYKQIQELIKTINKSNISELCIEEGEFKIIIKQELAAPAQYVSMPQMSMPMQQAAPQQAAAPVAQQAQNPAPAAEKPAAPAPASNTMTIKSPMIGTFYRSPSPDKPVFVNIGDEIKAGQVL